ncbi:MAG: phosphoribosylformylglycinamidine synthase subunit PurL [Candidatus Sumerlaeia bacterium]|nr:phosphoribosylformylglycinamidine synthase subunit PurL [Candidatus Sumerlaeia bacterium]
MSPRHSAEILKHHGVRPAEYAEIERGLGREPNLTELGIYSVMWSEHCSYKHSRRQLKTLPTKGERLLVGPGENAGVVDLGHGRCVVFKMESHNHPSAVEPFQGAATGVGGILRDIFTMGARPIAMLNNLRFGDPADPHMRRLIDGVVEGIASYGNCVGVPTVAGDAMFDAEHGGNILVNAMCVGIARTEDILLARASGAGNLVLYFGSATGRDGIHGATFASEELTEETLERRGAVQVGDPFMGKKILEATLELIRRKLVVGMQDMGAAGLTCSTCEMAARGGSGITVDLDKVPQRAEAMTAYEIMLSESQERMLAVVTPENAEAALEVCCRWDCGGAIIGEVADHGRVHVHHKGQLVADIPALHLTENAPLYDPAAEAPAPPPADPEPPALSDAELRDAAYRLLASPNVASKRWIYERYDHQVQTQTVLRPGDGDAAVLRVRGEGGAPDVFLSVMSGCNHRHVARDPRRGAQLAVMEVARNLACVGAEPLGLTNCLNFGSPENPRVFWTLREAIGGIGDACRALRIPVTGGNVSLYNESAGGAIPPTPMIGLVGEIADPAHITRPGFRAAGDAVLVLGEAPRHIGATEFDRVVLGAKGFRGTVEFDLARELALQHAVLDAIRSGHARSAHDVSEGGLLAALAECCLAGGLGAEIGGIAGDNAAVALFGELPGRVVLSCAMESVAAVETLAASRGVACERLGLVAEGPLRIGSLGDFTLESLRAAHETVPDGC